MLHTDSYSAAIGVWYTSNYAESQVASEARATKRSAGCGSGRPGRPCAVDVSIPRQPETRIAPQGGRYRWRSWCGYLG